MASASATINAAARHWKDRSRIMDILAPLLPASLSTELAVLLVALSFLTSAVTATFGIGGGLMMLAAMASTLPALAIIPVHATVQLGSNAGRAYVMRAHVDRALLGVFVVGAAVGAAIASQIVVALSKELLQLILGLFVLWSQWGPKPAKRQIGRGGFFLVGIGSTFATMFVGATGPLVAAFLSPERFGRHGTVANQAACMTAQHGLKMVAFGLIGFAFLEWIPLILAMIATGFLGTVIGKSLLDRLPESSFRILFKWVLTLLAFRLCWLWVETTLFAS